MSVRSFQQIVDDAAKPKPRLMEFLGKDDGKGRKPVAGFTIGKTYEVTLSDWGLATMRQNYFDVVADDADHPRFRPVTEFKEPTA